MPVIEPDKAEEIIPDKHLAFDLESKNLEEWFKLFGYEDEHEKFELCHKINASSNNPYEINQNVQEILEKVFD